MRQRQCITFVPIKFSCVLFLYVNCNLKANWQSCHPICSSWNQFYLSMCRFSQGHTPRNTGVEQVAISKVLRRVGWLTELLRNGIGIERRWQYQKRPVLHFRNNFQRSESEWSCSMDKVSLSPRSNDLGSWISFNASHQMSWTHTPSSPPPPHLGTWAPELVPSVSCDILCSVQIQR